MHSWCGFFSRLCFFHTVPPGHHDYRRTRSGDGWQRRGTQVCLCPSCQLLGFGNRGCQLVEIHFQLQQHPARRLWGQQMLSGYSGPQRGDYPKYPAAPRGTQIDKWFIIRQLGKGFRGFFCDFQESDVSSHTDSGQSAKQVIGTLLPELR